MKMELALLATLADMALWLKVQVSYYMQWSIDSSSFEL